MVAADPPVIIYSGGGYLEDYIAKETALEKSGRRVVLMKCSSACTVYLALPNACVTNNSLLGFHGAWNIDTGVFNEKDTLAMAEYWPAQIKAAVMPWVMSGVRGMRYMGGDEAISRGVPECKAGEGKKPNGAK